jgi:hypothetical protein
VSTRYDYISNWNVIFTKVVNYSLAFLLLFRVCPSVESSPLAFYIHVIGSFCFGFVAILNVVLIGVIWPKRPSQSFDPLPIVWAIVTMPMITLMDLGIELMKPLKLAKQLLALALCFYVIHFHSALYIPWFELSVFMDVWSFFAVFVVRKAWWMSQNFGELDLIVKYFKDTCWSNRVTSPRLEFIYCATTGLCTNFALQIGKLMYYYIAMVFFPRSLEAGGIFQTFYISCFVHSVLYYVCITQTSLGYRQLLLEVNRWFIRHHKYFHISGIQYLTKHFEHHDVLPLASIGGAGYNENLHRALCLTNFGPYCGYNNIMTYTILFFDEWHHNLCPATSNCDTLLDKPIHLEHHMNHTVPLGFIYDHEVKHNKFKYDEVIWDKVRVYLPNLKSKPVSKTFKTSNYIREKEI